MKSPLYTTLAISSVACCASAVSAFVPTSEPWGVKNTAFSRPSAQSTTSTHHLSSRSNTSLFSTEAETDDGWAIIRPEEDDDEWDLSLGGVGLAIDSAIKISGSVKGGDADGTKMTRYNKLTEASESDVNAAMSSSGTALVCSGLGQELYKDPGLTTVSDITRCPTDAVEKALSSAPNASALGDAKNVVINFLGGNDLIVDEVMDAIGMMVQNLDVGKAKVSFNSVSHKDIPDGTASVSVLSTAGGDGEGSGLTKAIASGEGYFYQGKWYAVLDEDVNVSA